MLRQKQKKLNRRPLVCVSLCVCVCTSWLLRIVFLSFPLFPLSSVWGVGVRRSELGLRNRWFSWAVSRVGGKKELDGGPCASVGVERRRFIVGAQGVHFVSLLSRRSAVSCCWRCLDPVCRVLCYVVLLLESHPALLRFQFDGLKSSVLNRIPIGSLEELLRRFQLGIFRAVHLLNHIALANRLRWRLRASKLSQNLVTSVGTWDPLGLFLTLWLHSLYSSVLVASTAPCLPSGMHSSAICLVVAWGVHNDVIILFLQGIAYCNLHRLDG